MTYATPEQRRAALAARRVRPDLAQKQDESGHGTWKTYSYWLCRCELCAQAARIQDQRYQQARKDARAKKEAALAERWARGEDV